jgi:hypothetical protein
VENVDGADLLGGGGKGVIAIIFSPYVSPSISIEHIAKVGYPNERPNGLGEISPKSS